MNSNKIDELINKVFVPKIEEFINTDRLTQAFNEFICGYHLSDIAMTKKFYQNAFLPWLLFNYRIDNGTLLVQYLCDMVIILTQEQEYLVLQIMESNYSFFQVLARSSGFILLHDLLLNSDVIVKDLNYDLSLVTKTIIFARIVAFDNQTVFAGYMPLSLNTSDVTTIIKLRDKLVSEVYVTKQTLNSGKINLSINDSLMRKVYFHLLTKTLHRN